MASGVTDEAGRYELISRSGGEQKTGAVPGKYTVSFSLYLKPDGTPVPPDSNEPPINLGAKESLPLQYSDSSMTKQTATVTQSDGTFDFKLVSD